MNRIICALFLILLGPWVHALPKVAVLDALLSSEVDVTLLRPVTDKVNEEFVNSGRYTVIARADLEPVYREKELLKGWDVSEQDAAATGQQVGADFVVITRLSRLEDTYSLSLKLIDVKTAVIVSQRSAESQGRKANLLPVSRDVAHYLATGEYQASKTNTARPDNNSDRPSRTAVPPAGPEDNPPMFRLVMDYAFTRLSGELYEQLVTYSGVKYPKYTFETQNGLELFLAANLSPNFYISGELDTYDYKVQLGSDRKKLYNLFNAFFGLGFSNSFSHYIRLNYGGFIGSTLLTMKEVSDSWFYSIETDGKTQATLGWGGEVNLELYPVNFFLINIRARAGFNNFSTDSGNLAADLMGKGTSHSALNFATISVGGGFAF